MSNDAAELLPAVRAALAAAGFPFGRGSSAGTMVVQNAPGLLPGSGPRVRVEYLNDYESSTRLRLEAVRVQETLVAAGFRCQTSFDAGVLFAFPGGA